MKQSTFCFLLAVGAFIAMLFDITNGASGDRFFLALTIFMGASCICSAVEKGRL